MAELLTGNTLELVEGMQYWQLMNWCSPCCGLLLQKGKLEEEEEQNSELGLRGRDVSYW